MIQVNDNFLPKDVFAYLQEYCQQPFQIMKVGDKEFSVLQTPMELLPYSQVPDHEMILTFIRSAYNGFDEEPRIHADNIINGEKTALASVIYINNTQNVTPNGTCFYEHSKYGPELPNNVTNEEFDELITKDSNDLSKWNRIGAIDAKPNRRLLYNSNCFHAKFPAKIEQGTRIVLVCFYKKK